jgi:hypothetical protein
VGGCAGLPRAIPISDRETSIVAVAGVDTSSIDSGVGGRGDGDFRGVGGASSLGEVAGVGRDPGRGKL